jgi:hypothetical protein
LQFDTIVVEGLGIELPIRPNSLLLVRIETIFHQSAHKAGLPDIGVANNNDTAMEN